jgi:glycosyltransferase involved in cell wall biosynthesis
MRAQKVSVALITNTISKPGGAEYVTIAMYDSLRKLKNVHVFILGREDHIDTNALAKWVAPDLAYDISKHYIHMHRFPLNTLLDLRKYNLIINTRSNEVLAPAHIHYLHWIFSPYGVKDSEALTYYRNTYGISDQYLKYLIRHVLHLTQIKVSRLVLANSRYVANLLKDLGVSARVLYPPVRSREIIQNTSYIRRNNREKIIVTITRIAPGKQLETIPLIASKVKDAKFILAGSLNDKDYYMKLLRLKKVFNADNFTIIPNIDTADLHTLLDKALIYLHTAKHEQFGIAVVEAMAAGAIPIVHKSGGPWHDILEERDGLYGYSYSTVEEAIEKIRDIISNPYRHVEVSERARLRALVFDEQIFKAKFREIIKSLLK